jgi:hypothetical protein
MEVENKFRNAAYLQVFQGISSCIKNIPLYIHPERDKEINHNRGPHSKKGNINKIFTYGRGSNAQLISDSGTNSKNMPFNKIFKPVHAANLSTFFSINKHFK